MSWRQDMSENPGSGTEERLRAALRARAADFPVSPDAWEQTLARRADTMTRLGGHRGGRLRWIAPMAAAAAVIAMAAGLLIERGSLAPGQPPAAPGGTPTASVSPSLSLVSLSPTHPPAPKGTRVPIACDQTSPPPPVYSVTEVTAGGMPAPARRWLQKAPAASAIVRVDVSYRGDRAVSFIWFSRHGSGPLTLQNQIAYLLPASANLDTVPWSGAGSYPLAAPAGRASQVFRQMGNRLVTYDLGLAGSQVASVTMTAGRGGWPMSGPTAPVPGLVISGHRLPYKVYLTAFPATPLYGELVLRDAAGRAIGEEGLLPMPAGTMCVPLAYLNYSEPRGGYAFVTGGSLPQVASVSVVLPDRSQVRGGFYPHGGTRDTGYFWYWDVRLPRKYANVTVTIVLRDAAGRTLGHFTTVPGKNPSP